MVRMTQARKRKLTRRGDGTFKSWKGGLTKAQLKKKNNNFQGIAIHIGAEFKKQHGHRPKVGDTVRFKRMDGKHHKGAFFYIRTKNGWRKSPTETRRPSAATIRRVNEASRPGRATVKRARRV